MLPPTGVNGLALDAKTLMPRWAPNVRELLLQSIFGQKLNWTNQAATVNVSWAGADIWQVTRPSQTTITTQSGLVRNYIDQRPDRSAEIMSQLGGFGAYFGIILGLSGARNIKTYELLDVVQGLAGFAAMLPKHMLACRRPDEIDARILPLIGTPGHGSFPSAHASQAFAMATVLAALIRSVPQHFADTDKRVDLLYRQAHRIAVNRTVAGVHFPMDSHAGALLGLQVGRALVGLMSGKTTLRPAEIYDPNTDVAADFIYKGFAATAIDAVGTPQTDIEPNDLFAWFWTQARAEFGGLTAAARGTLPGDGGKPDPVGETVGEALAAAV